MPMNLIHRRLCRSHLWAQRVASTYLPWALHDVDLGDDVAEIGPGYGATTAVLRTRTDQLTAIEIDPDLARRLRALFPDVDVVHANGAATGLPGNRFSAVTCFTMLHHVPAPALQDQVFAEACRMLRPGGMFAGADSLPTVPFRLIHVLDTMVLVDPTTLPSRLEAAGFTDIAVDAVPKRSFKFRARKPG